MGQFNAVLEEIMASHAILRLVIMAVTVESLISETYKDGSCTCTGTEEGAGRGGSGPRGFFVKCDKSGDNVEFRQIRVFRGNPHGCAEYNNKAKKGQETFYHQLIGQIGWVMCAVDFSKYAQAIKENKAEEDKTIAEK